MISTFETRTISLERAIEYKAAVTYGRNVPFFGVIEVFETYLNEGREAGAAKMTALETAVNEKNLSPRRGEELFVG